MKVKLKFIVQDLETGKHVKNFDAKDGCYK